MEAKTVIAKKELLLKIKQIKKQMIKWDWKLVVLFTIDVLVFALVVITFLVCLAAPTIRDNNQYLSYIILAGSFYILLKFSSTTFFFIRTYYQKIIIYDQVIVINKTKLHLKKQVDYKSVHFIVFFIIMNIVIAIILNDEASTLFKTQPVVIAFIYTSSLLLLMPSSAASLNNVLTIKKNLSNEYKVLIRNQFLANIDLFKDYQPVNNFECIQLKNLAVTSKRGTFLLANYEDNNIKTQVINQNEAIIKTYHDLWKIYCDYLFLINSVELDNKINRYTNFNIQNFFDFIFSDFFDF